MQTTLRAGAVVDFLSPGEFKKHLGEQLSTAFAEFAVGVKPMRFEATGTVSDEAVTIPAPQNGQLKLGPSPGFLWRVDRVSAYGLATGDSLAVHRTNTDGSAFLGYIPAATGYLDVPEAPLLQGGEFLVITGASLTATGQVIVNGEGAEVPALMYWKIA
jgi:hypothetical protein